LSSHLILNNILLIV